MDYNPDKWLVVKITGKDTPPVHKVFACWYGGYLDGDSWKLNSGITRAMLDGTVYSFDGSSGSIYYCNRESYGLSGYGNSVLSRMIDNAAENDVLIQILPEETNWLEINYE